MARTANRGMATDLQFTAQAPVWRLGKLAWIRALGQTERQVAHCFA